MDLKQYSLQYRKRSQAFKDVLEACQQLLRSHPAAQDVRDYANKRISADNLERFDFGFFPDDENIQDLVDLVGEKKLKALGLVYDYHVQNDNCRVFIKKGVLGSHNLITPYRDVYGNILAFVGRTTLPEAERKGKSLEKYKYSRFHRSLYLYGLHQAKPAILKRGSVILVEGQIDCITCHEYGIHNVVSLGGTAFTRYQFNLLRRYTDRFHLLLDNDAEGEKAQNKIVKRYSEYACIERLRLPVGYCKDVDEYLRQGHDKNLLTSC